MQRQFAYDRPLARLYLVDNGWSVKGATALLARELAVRRTVDIDIYRDTSRETAERDLREATTQDLGDWFRLETGRSTSVSDGANGVRISVISRLATTVWTNIVSRLATTVWTKFHVNVVAENIHVDNRSDRSSPNMTVWSAFPGELNSHRHLAPAGGTRWQTPDPQSNEEGRLRDDQ